MIEDSYVVVESNGKQVTVNWFQEEPKDHEGPAIFPARYPSMAGICAYIETQWGTAMKLSVTQAGRIQGLLGSPWPREKFTLHWKDGERR